MPNFWNERYRQPEYAYGEEPNDFLATQLAHFQPGSILFVAEGEGRNAVHAARQGWQVSAFDFSDEGRKKALMLAEKNGVAIDYQVADAATVQYPEGHFDAMVFVYAHFPAHIRDACYRRLPGFLRPGGILIFEAYSKGHVAYKQANPSAGGPGDPAMLFSEAELLDFFAGFEVLNLEEVEVEQEEGAYHQGKGLVIRFVGRKK